MKRVWRSAAVYGAAHFCVDLGCAFAVFSAWNGGSLGFLIYNFCAFALQMPIGLLADRFGHNGWTAALGCLLVALVCCLPSLSLCWTAVLGIGNGLFHIGGGLDVLNGAVDRAAPLGVFVSPGAMGLFCGTVLAKMGAGSLPVVLLLLLMAGLILILCRPARMPGNAALAFPSRSVLPVALALFLVVVLRSCGGMLVSLPWKSGLWSWIAVAAVVLGKALGGFLSDGLGAKKATALSLGLAVVLFCFSGNALVGTAALLLLNMTMPITLWAMAQRMPGCKGFSFGLLTFALFLGFLPSYFGAPSVSGVAMAALCLLSAGLLLLALHPCRGGYQPPA